MSVEAYLEATHTVGDYLLEVLDKACAELDVPYTLTAGTLLGAVRHGGWIPWDDDVDVALLRADYEQLWPRIAQLLPDDVRFTEGRVDPERQLTALPRLLYLPSSREHDDPNLATESVEREHLALDLFLLDFAPRDPRCALAWRRAVYYAERIIIWRSRDLRRTWRTGLPRKQRLVQVGTGLLSRCLTKRAWHRVHRLLSMLPGRLGARRVVMGTNYATHVSRYARFDAAWYAATVPVRFGDRDYPAPVGHDGVLRALFGADYWTPPPADEQQPIHLSGRLRVSFGQRRWDATN